MKNVRKLFFAVLWATGYFIRCRRSAMRALTYSATTTAFANATTIIF